MTVSDWPSYLLRGVPADTRALLSARAEADDVSLVDVVRAALCARYQLDCDPVSFRFQDILESTSGDLLIRVQPDVWRKLKREAGLTRTTPAKYGATKRLVMEALTDYLEGTQ